MKTYGLIALTLAITTLAAGIAEPNWIEGLIESQALIAISIVLFVISGGIFYAGDIEKGRRND